MGFPPRTACRAQSSSAISDRRGCRTIALATALALGPAAPVASQVQVEAPGIRMVATFDPATDARTFEVLEPMSASEVLALQSALARAGSDPGPLDARLGPGTRSALERFQRERGLRACGCVTHETVVALGLRPLVVQTIVGSARPVHGVEVILPTGPPPARPTAPTDPAAAEPAQPDAPTGYVEVEPGWWIPVFPHHPPVIEPLRGSGRRGDRGGAGDRGGILLGPGVADQSPPGGVRVISPPSRRAPPREAPRAAPRRRPPPPK